MKTSTRTHTNTQIHTLSHAHTHAHTHTCTYKHTHTHTRTHTHTHTRTHTQVLVDRAGEDGRSLEDVHVLTMAHVLSRPIIIYSSKVLEVPTLFATGSMVTVI